MIRGNVRSGKCPSGKWPFGEVSVGEMSSANCPSGKSYSGKCPSGKCLSGNHPRTFLNTFSHISMVRQTLNWTFNLTSTSIRLCYNFHDVSYIYIYHANVFYIFNLGCMSSGYSKAIWIRKVAMVSWKLVIETELSQEFFLWSFFSQEIYR